MCELSLTKNTVYRRTFVQKGLPSPIIVMGAIPVMIFFHLYFIYNQEHTILQIFLELLILFVSEGQ